MSIGNDSPSAVVTRDLRHVLAQAAFFQERLPLLQASIRALIDENALLRSQLAELEVSLQALKEENAMLRDERRIDNEEAARLYDFARNKGEALERQAVVAWLREYEGHSSLASLCALMADAIERGEHRREEGA